jgi:diguanylate cyclase (GGDEF)-like protein
MMFVALLTQSVIEELTIRDIQNVTRLTHVNIFTEIEHEMLEPINASLIMAQNTFLLDIMDEDTLETETRIAEYLTSIQKATGYESVFTIPDSTLNYYHPGGTDEKVDLESEHAYWYTNRIDATDAYGFVVNTENLDDWALTIYVDANIKDRNGNFTGITGVGKRITHLQSILTSYLKDQGVEAYIVDGEGMIKVHENSDYIKNMSFYELESIPPEAINVERGVNQPFETRIDDQFFIVQQIPKLDWYLVVKKSASELTGALNHYSLKVIGALAFGAMVILLVTNMTIAKYKKQIVSLSNIDHLTQVSNRTVFEMDLIEAIRLIGNQHFSLAIFDLDNLKTINDRMGHDKGDYTLKLIAKLAKETFNEPDSIYRVGGDEFAIMIYRPLEEAKLFVENFKERVNNNIHMQGVGSTVSIGLTQSIPFDTETTVYKRADEALYMSKNDGKDKITAL